MSKAWYQKEAVYQIYPRSFMDSNNDGIGDLEGIISKLDYIKAIGVGIIWLSPIYASPMYDNGYDISDYYAINPEFGTMEDFDTLIAEVHKRGMRLIMDLVINHTSSEHYWFKEAKKGLDNPYHDYYIWRKKANNWTGFFGGSTWTYNEASDEYYLHLFAKEQPDLNWENPQVRKEIKAIISFWLDKGVDGFRCDVINLLSKTPSLPNAFPSIVLTGRKHFINGPNIHKYLAELKKDVFDHYDCFTVGEAVFLTAQKALTYIEGEKELNMLFQFEHMGADNYFIKWFPHKYRPRKLKKALSKWQEEVNPFAWNTLYFENHDQPRSLTRFGSLAYHYHSATMLATYLYLQKGTIFIYQGQEIGMTNASFDNINDYRDIETLRIYRQFVKIFGKKKMMKKIKWMSRDNARTPMQWDSSLYGGFSKAKPWLKVNSNYQEINVANNIKDEKSILAYYRALLAMRKENEVFLDGDYKEYYKRDKVIFCYKRSLESGEEAIILGNMSSKNNVRIAKINLDSYELILNNYEDLSDRLKAYEVRVYLKR